jgi:predicted O-methyltransferase YrrM
MFTTKNEQSFFLDNLKKEYSVFEWGSGESTLEIAGLVKRIVSVEHNETWYNTVKSTITDNIELHHVPQTVLHVDLTDGTYEQYESYVNFIKNYKKGDFDVILIDGRARLYCAMAAISVCTEDTLVFIHDFLIPPIAGRETYLSALNYYKIDSTCESMVKLKIK